MPQVSHIKLDKILRLIIIGGSFIVVMVPLIIFPYSYYPHVTLKTIVFRMLMELGFCAYLVLALLRPEYRPRKSVLLWAVLAFAGVMMITTFTSQSITRSWWGSWERMFGAFNYLHYFAWFVVLVSVFKSHSQWRWILNLTLFVSFIISLYALSQRFGLTLTSPGESIRVTGTIGNATHLAAYLLFHVFIALFLAVEISRWRWKACYLLIFMVDLSVVMLTGTRGALFALVISLLVFVILAFLLKIQRRKAVRTVLVFSILLISIGVGLFAFRGSSFVKSNYWLRRLTDVESQYTAKNTVQTRFCSWKWGLMGFRDNFLLGVGPENYQIVFNEHFESDFYDYSPRGFWFDRAHNTLIDMASTMGIFGLMAYLGIFAAVIYLLLDLQRKRRLTPVVFIILTLLFLCYFSQNLFTFDTINSLIVFFLLLAYVSFAYYQGLPGAVESGKHRLKKVSPYLTIPVVIILFAILFIFVNLPEIKANRYVYNAFINDKSNKYAESIICYDKAYQAAVNKIEPAVLVSNYLNGMTGGHSSVASKERKIKDLQTAAHRMDKAIELDPKNMFLHFCQAKNYSVLAELSGEAKYIGKGIESARRAHELSPNRVRPLWILGQLYLFAHQPEKALEYLDEAIKIYPIYAAAYLNRGIVYSNKGDYFRAERDFSRAIEIDPNFTAAYFNRGAVYYNKGDKCSARADFRKAKELGHPSAQAALERLSSEN